jgi:photosystem II stability/assembly factor-like uncharacterized protein
MIAAASTTLALILATQVAADLPWKELGPAPTSGAYTGRISAIACSPTDPGRYFVAGADGGVWRSLDAGTTWTALTAGLPSSAIGALTLDPQNENVIYAGTGEANFANHSRYGLGLYKSTDGGNTWVQLAEGTFGGRCFARIVCHPTSASRVYAAITRAGGFPELAAAKGHPGATGPVGVFRSDDGGATWTPLTNGLPQLSATDLALNPADPNVLYAAIGHIFGSPQNGIYKSTDAGASWSKLAGGLPSTGLGRINLAIAPSQPARVYALLTNDADAGGGSASTRGAFRSDDAGASWTNLGIGDFQQTYGWYLSAVSAKPDDPAMVFMCGFSLLRTLNSGSSWSDRTPPHVDLHAIAWDALGTCARRRRRWTASLREPG